MLQPRMQQGDKPLKTPTEKPTPVPCLVASRAQREGGGEILNPQDLPSRDRVWHKKQTSYQDAMGGNGGYELS
jgi:hypothetical protein